MPPPTMKQSTFCDSESSNDSLVETFEPPTIATTGFLGLCIILASASTSAASKGPAQAIGAYLMIPQVDASSRCAVAKASMTNTSQSLAIFCDNSLVLSPSPLLKRTFSNKTTSWSFIEKPPTQCLISGTSIFNNRDK